MAICTCDVIPSAKGRCWIANISQRVIIMVATFISVTLRRAYKLNYCKGTSKSENMLYSVADNNNWIYCITPTIVWLRHLRHSIWSHCRRKKHTGYRQQIQIQSHLQPITCNVHLQVMKPIRNGTLISQFAYDHFLFAFSHSLIQVVDLKMWEYAQLTLVSLVHSGKKKKTVARTRKQMIGFHGLFCMLIIPSSSHLNRMDIHRA